MSKFVWGSKCAVDVETLSSTTGVVGIQYRIHGDALASWVSCFYLVPRGRDMCYGRVAI